MIRKLQKEFKISPTSQESDKELGGILLSSMPQIAQDCEIKAGGTPATLYRVTFNHSELSFSGNLFSSSLVHKPIVRQIHPAGHWFDFSRSPHLHNSCYAFRFPKWVR